MQVLRYGLVGAVELVLHLLNLTIVALVSCIDVLVVSVHIGHRTLELRVEGL